jgi:hypothetical protein
MKHLEHTLATYVYNHCNIWNILIYFCNTIWNTCNIPLEHLKHSKHTITTFASRHNIYLLLGWMEAQCRAGRAYQQHDRGSTSVCADRYPTQRMSAGDGGRRGGRGRSVVGWVEGHQGWLTTVPVLRPWRASEKRGRQRDLLDEHAQGNYEPEAELVELGVWRERARRNGATTTGGATGSADPVRARELQP